MSPIIILFAGIIFLAVTISTRKLKAVIRKRTSEVTLQKTIIEKKNSELELINKDITDSITYAKKIQETILPSRETWYSLLPESFILYKPKAIVSGDFYWISEIKSERLIKFNNENNGILFCAADCTGHGVPGAFMSMLCSSLLNDAVNEKGLENPASIFNEIRKQIIVTLKQQGIPGEAKDGMDASLCALIKENGEDYILLAACANNPIFILCEKTHNNLSAYSSRSEIKRVSESENHILFTMMPDSQPVAISDIMFPFTKYELKLKKGDCIYLASDGIKDQFGGPKGKKFKSRQLCELLLSVGHIPMDEQYQIIDKTINDWMKNHEQTDDMLLIGIKV